ncbi:MAG: InlB B-repeat-containing protein [Christensenellaceae bacterium]
MPATCSQDGKQVLTCSRCGDVLEVPNTEDPATGIHDYSVEIYRTEATCTTDGSVTYQCATCDGVKTETIVTEGHDYERSDIPATCTESGQILMTCSRCGDSFTRPDSESPALGHDMQIISSRPATCTEDGYTTYHCSRCDESYTEAIAALEHSYAQTGTIEASCTVSGRKVYSCMRCGESFERPDSESPALGHDYAIEISHTEASCTAEGEVTYRCIRCEATDTEIIPKTEHQYQDRECSICGALDYDHVVSFVVMGSTVSCGYAVDGETVAVPMAPELQGYRFVTWKYYDGSGAFVKFTDEIRITDDLIVYAVYDTVYVTVSITDAVTGSVNTYQIVYGMSVNDNIVEPHHFGYHFDGYTRDGAGVEYDPSLMVETDLHLTANFTIQWYGVVWKFVSTHPVEIAVAVAVAVFGIVILKRYL